MAWRTKAEYIVYELSTVALTRSSASRCRFKLAEAVDHVVAREYTDFQPSSASSDCAITAGHSISSPPACSKVAWRTEVEYIVRNLDGGPVPERRVQAALSGRLEAVPHVLGLGYTDFKPPSASNDCRALDSVTNGEHQCHEAT